MEDRPDGDTPRKDKPTGEERQPVPQVREQHEREEALARKLGAAERRKVEARERDEESVWFGLGTFGLVGWSVAIPTLIGLALGIWLDRVLPLGFSWTLTLLVVGVTVGCINAWYWISREREEIGGDRDEPADEETLMDTKQEDEDGD